MLSKWCTKFRMTYMFLGFCGRREDGNISNVRWFGALNMYVNLQSCPFSWAVKDVGQERQRTQETFAFEFQRVLNCWARRWRKCICSNSFSREYQNRLCQHHNNNAVWGWKLGKKKNGKQLDQSHHKIAPSAHSISDNNKRACKMKNFKIWDSICCNGEWRFLGYI